MIIALLPETNHKPDWVEIRVDGAHMANIWAHTVEATLDRAVNQFMVAVSNANECIEAYLWVDAIQQRPPKK